MCQRRNSVNANQVNESMHRWFIIHRQLHATPLPTSRDTVTLSYIGLRLPTIYGTFASCLQRVGH